MIVVIAVIVVVVLVVIPNIIVIDAITFTSVSPIAKLEKAPKPR